MSPALAANPDLWNSTVFILNYDENDGLFDHVPPPAPPPGTPGEFVDGYSVAAHTPGGGLPIGPGFRVPCIIVSPWTVGGFVNSDLSDHTSVLQFLEQVTGVKCKYISDWRRRTMSDLTPAFGPARPSALPGGAGPGAAQVDLATYEAANLPSVIAPTTEQWVPHQEPGPRPRVGGGYPYPPPPRPWNGTPR